MILYWMELWGCWDTSRWPQDVDRIPRARAAPPETDAASPPRAEERPPLRRQLKRARMEQTNQLILCRKSYDTHHHYDDVRAQTDRPERGREAERIATLHFSGSHLIGVCVTCRGKRLELYLRRNGDARVVYAW